MSWEPEDQGLREAVAVLEPTPGQVARLQVVVAERVERERVGLLDEWLGLVRARPVANGGLALAGALGLMLTTPLGSLLWALLRSGVA